MIWEKRVAKIEVGDKVCYKASFLRDTGQTTGEIPFARGMVESIKDYGGVQIAIVDWGVGNEEVPCKVNTKNLSKVTQRGVADE